MLRLIRLLALVGSVASSLSLVTAVRAQAPEDDATRHVITALNEHERTTSLDVTTTDAWTWREFQLHDGGHPLTIDVVADNHEVARKVIYLLPGGGTNFRSSFMSPVGDNLAHYLHERGYLVVGITAREDLLLTTNDPTVAGWGMAAHRTDTRSVVSIVQKAADLPYEVLGISYGASTALDYASLYSDEIDRVIALDIYSIDPKADPEGIANAEKTYAAHVELLKQGVIVDDTGAGANALGTWSQLQLDLDSGMSREPYGAAGNFTYETFFFFAAIEGAQLPGIHTALTGLAGDWPSHKGTFAGEYTFAPNPLDDSYTLEHLDRSVIEASSVVAGSGLIPMAFARDYWSVVAGNGAYELDWSGISCELVWVNNELGYNDQYFGASQTTSAANEKVTTAIIDGYGHGDILLSRTAREDVWDKVF